MKPYNMSIHFKLPLDSATLTQDKHNYLKDRTINSQGWGSTEGGMAVARAFMARIEAAIINTPVPNTRMPEDFFRLDPSMLALIATQGILDTAVNQEKRSKTGLTIGTLAEMETFTVLARDWCIVSFEKRQKALDKYLSVGKRREAIYAAFPELKDVWKPWSAGEKSVVGNWLIEATYDTGLFFEYKAIDPKLKSSQRRLVP